MIAYALEEEGNEEIEFTLPKEILPYGVTAIITAEGTAGIGAIYYSLQE